MTAKHYVESTFDKITDSAIQPIILGALVDNIDFFKEMGAISSKDFYDNMYLPFALKVGKHPSQSQRSNFLSGALDRGRLKESGPFGGMGTHILELRREFLDTEILELIREKLSSYNWAGTTRSKKMVERANAYLRSDELTRSLDHRAQDAGVDSKSSFRGITVPIQVKSFEATEEDIRPYVEREPLYQQGGGFIAPSFSETALTYMKLLKENYYTKYIVSNESEESLELFYWKKK